MPPFFSIITASLNNGSSISITLESVKGQSFQDFEHIISDGGSQDDSQQILAEYKKKYNLKWLSKTDNGISEALNRALKLARGKYIVVIGADDRFLKPNILELAYPLLRSEVIDILSYPVLMQDAVKGNVLRDTIRCRWWNHFKFIFQHQGCFVHRRVFEKIGGFREEFKIALDYDFFYRALKSNCSVRFEKHPIVIMGGEGIGSQDGNIPYRIREEGLVHQLNEQNIIWRLAQHIFRFLYVPYKTKLMPGKGVIFNNYRREPPIDT
jgi:glycosyltransferase involved in cell wall biosynthesis